MSVSHFSLPIIDAASHSWRARVAKVCHRSFLRSQEGECSQESAVQKQPRHPKCLGLRTCKDAWQQHPPGNRWARRRCDRDSLGPCFSAVEHMTPASRCDVNKPSMSYLHSEILLRTLLMIGYLNVPARVESLFSTDHGTWGSFTSVMYGTHMLD